jgi:hypothetical protein
MYCSKPKKETFVSINKLTVFAAAFMLALALGSMPVGAQACNPADPAADCDNDGIPNGQDTCDNLLDPIGCADDDGDGIVNKDDECPNTDAAALGTDLVIDQCTATGVVNTLSPNGCSLEDLIMECAEGAKNHGKFVSCVARLTNGLKRQKIISGAQKGNIQSCAAQSDIGKKPHP